MLQKIKVQTLGHDDYQSCNIHGEVFKGKLMKIELPYTQTESQILHLCPDCISVYQTAIQLAQTGSDMDFFSAEKTIDTKVLEVK